MILFEYLHTFFQLRILMVFDKRRAHTQTFLMRTCRNQTDGTHAVVHQFASQFTARHAWIANREIKAVGNRLVEVAVIHDAEMVTAEDVLQFAGTLTIHFHLIAEVVLAVASGTQHGCHGVLRRMTCSRREGIEHTGGENQSEWQSLVASRQVVVMTMEQLVTDASHSDALSSITECLGTTDEDDVVVRVVSHRWLIRRFESLAEILTEIHGKVGEVLHHNRVVLRCQTANGAQLLLVQANPCRVVRIAVENGTDVSLREVAFQLRT